MLGLDLLETPTNISAAFRLGDGGVLLLFDPARSSLPGRPVPSHGASGAGHVDALRRAGVAIEQEVTWSERGRSVYARDPAGNSVELVEGEAWPMTPRDA